MAKLLYLLALLVAGTAAAQKNPPPAPAPEPVSRITASKGEEAPDRVAQLPKNSAPVDPAASPASTEVQDVDHVASG